MLGVRKASASVLVLGLVLLAGCTDREGSAGELCRVLSEPSPPYRWDGVDVMVFVDPAAEEREVESLRRALDRSDEVAGTTWVSQQQAYDEFADLFAGTPEMIEAVRPEIMPARLEVRLVDRSPASVGAFGRRFEVMPGVYRVVNAPGEDMSVIDRSIRPLTSELGTMSSAFTMGRATIDLVGVAPPEMRDHAQALEELWAEPWSASEQVRERAVEAARQVAAFYDTECE